MCALMAVVAAIAAAVAIWGSVLCCKVTCSTPAAGVCIKVSWLFLLLGLSILPEWELFLCVTHCRDLCARNLGGAYMGPVILCQIASPMLDQLTVMFSSCSRQ